MAHERQHSTHLKARTSLHRPRYASYLPTVRRLGGCILYVLLGLSWNAQLMAQGGWIRQNASHTLRQVQFVDASRGWVVGDGGSILHSSDGGLTWTPQVSKTTRRLQSVHFVDANLGFVVGHDGVIRKTTDGGTTWVPKWSGITEHLLALYFVDAQTGWAAGNEGLILKTVDGGESWRIARAASENSPSLWDMYLEDAITGWAVGEEGTVLKTINGETWTPKTITPSTTETLSSIAFYDADTGYAVGRSGGIFKTKDQGETWQTLTQSDGSPFTSSFLNDVYVEADPSIVWALGNRGLMLKSEDWGHTWTAQTNSAGEAFTEQPLQALSFFPTTSIGWAVGNGGILLRTTDAGDTWTTILSTVTGLGDLSAVHFVTKDTGWVVGANGKILKTTDGGEKWTLKPSGTTGGLNAVHFINTTTGWAVGTIPSGRMAQGMVLRTTDGGDTWTRTLIPDHRVTRRGTVLFTENGFRAVYFVNERTGYAGGDRLWKTVNRGVTWTLVESAPRSLHDIQFLDARTGWLSSNNIIHKTTDSGTSWLAQNRASSPSPRNYGAGSVYALHVGPSYIWAVGGSRNNRERVTFEELARDNLGDRFEGIVAFSVHPDGLLRAGIGKILRGVCFVNSSKGWVVGDGGTIAHTRTGTASSLGNVLWERQASGVTSDLQDIFFVGQDTAWVVGDRGLILRTTNGGAASDDEAASYFHLLPADDRSVENEEGDFMLSVVSNASWTVATSAAWLNLLDPSDDSPLTSGQGDALVKVAYTQSANMQERTATLTFTAGTRTEEVVVRQVRRVVSQLEAVPQFPVGIMANTLPREAGSFDITVTSNVDWTLELEDAHLPAFIVSADPRAGEADDAFAFVTVMYSRNERTNPRSARLRFASADQVIRRDISLMQVATSAPVVSSLTIVPSGQHAISSEQGVVPIRVLSNTSWTLSPSASADWITPSLSGGSMDRTVRLSYTANTGPQREATLTFTAMGGSPVREIRCVQSPVGMTPPPPLPSLSLHPQPLAPLSSEEGETTLEVFSNTQWTVSKSEDTDWLRLLPLGGNQNRMVTISYDMNTSSRRQVTLTFTAMGGTPVEEINITQLAQNERPPPPSATLSISPTTLPPLSSAAGDIRVQVFSNTTWTTATPADAAWITLSPARGSRDGALVVSYTENGSAQRHATLAFTATGGTPRHTLEVIQRAENARPLPQVPTISVMPGGTQQVSSAAGVWRVDVVSNTTWTIRKSTSVTWITLNPASGDQNANVTVNYAANGGGARSAILVFRAVGASGRAVGERVEIAQAAAQEEGPLGTTEELSSVLHIHPNPTTHRLSIRVERKGICRLLDMQGRILFSHAMEAGERYTLDLSPQAEGLYLLEFQEARGTIVRRLVLK